MDDTVKHPIAKLVSVPFALAGGLSWGDIASMLAAGYTALLILDFVWVKWVRPMLRDRGYIAPGNGDTE